MKVVIFAGGIGSRISEESHLKPKPMIEIGLKPILWHILKQYEFYGYKDFIICLGYKGYMIKEYFMNYFMHNSNVTIDLKNNKVEVHQTDTESFKVTLIDTGLHTQTAGRLKRVQHYIGEEDFMLTYGDGLSDINIKELVKFHFSHGKIATITTTQIIDRYGILDIEENNLVDGFIEKPKESGSWINAGFFVLKPDVFKYLKDDADSVMWEQQPLEDITRDGEMVAFKHKGFWKCMDAIRDKIEFEQLWETGNAKWKIWE